MFSIQQSWAWLLLFFVEIKLKRKKRRESCRIELNSVQMYYGKMVLLCNGNILVINVGIQKHYTYLNYIWIQGGFFWYFCSESFWSRTHFFYFEIKKINALKFLFRKWWLDWQTIHLSSKLKTLVWSFIFHSSC